jgi:CTD small phosphatase-like protein 2
LRKLIVVLDLDECLVHSTDFRGEVFAGAGADSCYRQWEARPQLVEAAPEIESFRLELGDGSSCTVHKRTGLDAFLKACAEEFDLFAFTAGTPVYAGPLLDRLDPHARLFKGRRYREHCRAVATPQRGVQFLKDLCAVADEEELKRCVLVDNNPVSFVCQPSNGIQVPHFVGQPDRVLDSLLQLLRNLAPLPDVRRAVAQKAPVSSERHVAFSPRISAGA